jgi:hypothetical protein
MKTPAHGSDEPGSASAGPIPGRWVGSTNVFPRRESGKLEKGPPTIFKRAWLSSRAIKTPARWNAGGEPGQPEEVRLDAAVRAPTFHTLSAAERKSERSEAGSACGATGRSRCSIARPSFAQRGITDVAARIAAIRGHG